MPRYGIDTSILVRLLTGEPATDYEQTAQALERILLDDPAAEIVASNMVIGEAYFVLQHHYQVSKEGARSALISVLTSGLVKPRQGPAVLKILAETRGPGLMDCLIVSDYSADDQITFTNDRQMQKLPGCRLLT